MYHRQKRHNSWRQSHLLFNNMLKAHDLLLAFVSNPIFLFILQVYNNLCGIFGIKVKLSMAFDSKIDRHSKISYEKIEKHPSISVNYHWDKQFKKQRMI